eukprot:gene24753-biopygen13476
MSCMNTRNARPAPMTNLVQPNPAYNGRPSVNPRHFPVDRVPPGARQVPPGARQVPPGRAPGGVWAQHSPIINLPE